MSSIRKVLTMTKLLIILMSIFCFIGFHLGYDGLFLVGEINLPLWLYGLISQIIFDIQLTLSASIIFDIYSKRIFKYMWPLYLFNLISMPFIGQTLISTILIPYGYILCRTHLNGDIKKSLKRFINFSIPYALYNFAFIVFKIGMFYLGYNKLSQYQYLMSLVDMSIFIYIFYLIGGIRYYERVLGLAIRKFKWEYFLFPEEINSAEQDIEDVLAEEAFGKLQGFKRAKAITLLLLIQVLQWIIILIVCNVGNVLIEGLIITTSFVAHGFVIKNRWHSKSLIVCTLTSSVMFFVLSKISISFKYSQFFPIVIGLLLIYCLYRLNLILENHTIKKSQQQFEQIQKLEKDVEELWKSVDDIY